MLSIGRALMGRPKLLLLDEPSLGLAPRLMAEIFATFKEMNQKGLTLFIVEQEIGLSLDISSRGYLLRNGRVIKEGSASKLLESRELTTSLGAYLPDPTLLLSEEDRNREES